MLMTQPYKIPASACSHDTFSQIADTSTLMTFSWIKTWVMGFTRGTTHLLLVLRLFLKAGWNGFGGMTSSVVSRRGGGPWTIILTAAIGGEARFFTVTMARGVV